MDATDNNDTNTPWASGFLGTLGSLAGTAGQAYKDFTGKNSTTPANQAAVDAGNKAPSWMTWLPLAVAGVAVLLIGVLLLRRK
jgi:hypothetical protein